MHSKILKFAKWSHSPIKDRDLHKSWAKIEVGQACKRHSETNLVLKRSRHISEAVVPFLIVKIAHLLFVISIILEKSISIRK